MKKIIFLFFVFVFANNPNQLFAQAGEWIWLHGDSTINSLGDFGTQGISSPTNKPPSVYEACEWTDLNGNFWLFGGYGISGSYAALWKYNSMTNEWTWMKGANTIDYGGNYGTQGVPSATNAPPNLSHGAASWTSKDGNLWLFGGVNRFRGALSDLWRYEISTNEWTWMKGPYTSNQSGIYGTQGIPDVVNYPPSRWECAANWTDNEGNLWLFGGYMSTNSSHYNDLWKYNITTNMWTWMKGSNTINQSAIYGTLGIENTINTPGASNSYTHWKDA